MDNSFIIDNLLQREESVRLRFIENADIDVLAKSITAFINTEGGDVVVGVDGNKKVVGVNDAQRQLVTIQQDLVRLIRPTAPISVQLIRYNQHDLLLISVWEGARKPYQYDGVIYNRVGKVTEITKPDRLSALISQRKESEFNWERMSLLGVELTELDNTEIKKTIDSYKEYKADAVIEDTEDFLIQLGLIQNGNITNSCMVLFGKNPLRYIPQSRIRLTLYPSKTSGNSFIDDKIFEGNIFKNIEDIFNYLDVIYGKSSSVSNILRKDRINYPIVALREGIMNAIVHRDYNSIKGFLQISIFSDRTEISNYGDLPSGITISDLRSEHHSILRNPDIARICFIRRFIEMLGSGTLRMIRDCKQNKFRAPVWQEGENTITVTFPGVTHHRKDEGVNEGVSEGVREGVSKDNLQKLEKIAEWVTKGAKGEVSERITSLLVHLYKDGGARTGDIEAITRIPRKTLERYLRRLKKSGVISHDGNVSAGIYVLNDISEVVERTLGHTGIDRERRTDDSARELDDTIIAILNDGVSDGDIDGVSDGVRTEIMQLVRIVQEQEGIRVNELVEKTDKSRPTIERYLKITRDAKLLEFKGAPKTGGYYITDSLKRKLASND
ncbi:ATP-binding protein [Dyadobacter sp. 32]|uniref:ATP-binding protein n=1 Tax=Dyadobacter sp. 32 TaxID=538966 RepID=UPI0011EBEFDD